MKLIPLIKTISNCRIASNPRDFEVSGISCDSKKVAGNFIFVAVKGVKEDGHKFIREAIDRGAKAVIAQSLEPIIPGFDYANFITAEDTRRVLAELAAEFYGRPSSKVKVVGITGTNGKTTISYLIEAILKEADFNPAVVGTINYRFKNKISPSNNTTPGPIELQSMLSDMVKEGVDYAVMEVSSHALSQDRVRGVDFHCAIFTNLTQDHLDYHKTLENYFKAKTKLFKDISPASFIVINNDDSYGIRLKGLTPAQIITYGIKNDSDLMAREIKFDVAHTKFTLVSNKYKADFKSCLIGRHNIYNILAAVSFALKEGIDLREIKSAIEKLSFVPGRLERIDFKGSFYIFVDYAHTEDALANVIRSLRLLSENKIIVVFGCGGERDKAKRPKMGGVVSELADYAIITNDNPRSEDPQLIINDIKSGIGKDNYCVITDRKEAIKKSLALAGPGDIVLIAGKGHENYQILNDKIIPFDDCRIVRECLESMKY